MQAATVVKKEMTIPQYAKQIKNVSRQAVLKSIKKNKLHLLPNVVSFRKINKDYILEVAI